MKKEIGFITVLTILGIPSLAIAGRPVIREATLEQLVARSHLIAIVQKRQPFTERSTQLESGCKGLRWPFLIKEVLNQQTTLKVVPNMSMSRPSNVIDSALLKELAMPGKKVDVLFNQVSVQDCQNRLVNGSGASFPAERYNPSMPDLLTKRNEFIVFMMVQGKDLVLTTITSIESTTKKDEVIRIAKQVKQSAQPAVGISRGR